MFYPQSSWAKSYFFVLVHSNMWPQIDINLKNSQSSVQTVCKGRWMGPFLKIGGMVEGQFLDNSHGGTPLYPACG